MRFFHKRTKTQNIHMLWQSLIVFAVMLVFMYAVRNFTLADGTLAAIGATSLGSSAFLVFVAHDTAMAQTRRILSGYFFGLLVGVSASLVLHIVVKCHMMDMHCNSANMDVLFAACAAMLTMLLMVTFSSEHPPAVGIAIGLVIRHWSVAILLIVVATVLLIALLRLLLKPWLLNLL